APPEPSGSAPGERCRGDRRAQAADRGAHRTAVAIRPGPEPLLQGHPHQANVLNVSGEQQGAKRRYRLVPPFLVVVGARGFEPPTSASRTLRAAGLRHAPWQRTEITMLSRFRQGRTAPTRYPTLSRSVASIPGTYNGRKPAGSQRYPPTRINLTRRSLEHIRDRVSTASTATLSQP